MFIKQFKHQMNCRNVELQYINYMTVSWNILRSPLLNSIRLLSTVFMETNATVITRDDKNKENSDTATENEHRKRLQTESMDDEHKKIKTSETVNNFIDNINNTKMEVEPILDTDSYEILDTPIKSRSDSKEYFAVKLRNGLRVLLISDVENLINLDLPTNESDCVESETNSESGVGDNQSSEDESSDENCDRLERDHEPSDKPPVNKEKLAACALTVGVGSFSDPDEIPGMAHFLEHMLFMGSTKYPKENEFDSYLSSRGGSDNAVTECEQTTFYFDCPEIHLEGAIDRFSNLFTAPLMNRDSINRERESIESEFKSHFTSDSTRLEQLFCGTASDDNPARKFMWGNLVTLKENIQDDVLYTQLQNFWARHYSAHRMTAAIQGRLPINTLLEWADKYFGDIPSNNLPPDTFSRVDFPFKIAQFHKVYTVQPINDTNKLQITWVLPPMKEMYRSKPMSYFSFLIGHEGEGSLLSYLHDKLWALNITAGNGETGIEENSVYSLFSIDISLTEEGLSNLENILDLVFSYIKLIKNTKSLENIYQELKLINDINFNFAEEIDPSDNVEDLSQQMHIYPPADYICGSQLLSEYDPKTITEIANLLSPEKVNIMLLSKIAAEKVNLNNTEPWFTTKFNLEDIREELVTRWRSCEPDPSFHLPEKNQYITSNFDLLPAPSDLPEYPQQIFKDKLIELWYKQDNKYKLPIGGIKIYMISPIASSLPQNYVMCNIYISLLNFITAKNVYSATMAGLTYRLKLENNGLVLICDGYNEKLPLFLEIILKEFVALGSKVSCNLFETVKEETRKYLYNRLLKSSSLATDLRLSILYQPYWTTISKLDSLPHITLDKFKLFCQNLIEEMYVKCLIQGNIDKRQSLDISSTVTQILNHRSITYGCAPYSNVRKLPLGENIIRVTTFNDEDPNCNVTNYFQIGLKNIRDSCKLELLMMIIQEPLFDRLRTQEQLGYEVSCETRDTNGVLGFSVTVKSQADKFKVDYVEERITAFLFHMKDELRELSLEDFNEVKKSMIILKQQRDNDLKSEVQKNWNEIISGEYLFNRNEMEVKCIENLKLSDVADFFGSVLKEIGKKEKDKSTKSNINLRKLSIQVDSKSKLNGSTHMDDVQPRELSDSNCRHELKIQIPNDEKSKRNYIQDIEKFKNTLYKYPNLNPSMDHN